MAFSFKGISLFCTRKIAEMKTSIKTISYRIPLQFHGQTALIFFIEPSVCIGRIKKMPRFI